MDLLSLALSLSLAMDGPKFTGDYTLDASPVFGVATGMLPRNSVAMTLPGVILYRDDPTLPDEFRLKRNPELLRHELEHVAQQSALGPAFWLGYGATAGRAFEPYDIFNLGAPSSYGDQHEFRNVWTAPDEMVGNYPLFRVARAGDETRLQLLPGYPGVSFEAQVR